MPYADRAAIEDAFRRMQEETQSLRHLMNDFLALSRMESGDLVFERTPLALAPLVTRACYALSGQFASRASMTNAKAARCMPFSVDASRS